MDRAEAPQADLALTIACSPQAGEAVEWAFSAPAGSTVLQALQRSGAIERCSGIDLATQAVGIWGRRCQLQDRPRDGDRIEVYRPLTIDPKEARRRRQRAQQTSR